MDRDVRLDLLRFKFGTPACTRNALLSTLAATAIFQGPLLSLAEPILMSSEIENMLSAFGSVGQPEGEGQFTIDLSKAQEKMAHFQLPDPHEFLLKLVQAGNLAASAVCVELKNQICVDLDGWPADLSLPKIAERLANPGLTLEHDALSYLCVGLRALTSFCPEVQVRQSLSGQPGRTLMTLARQATFSHESTLPFRTSRLRVSIKRPQVLSLAKLRSLLVARCGLGPVPLRLDGQEVPITFPSTSGSHRPKGVRADRVLAQTREGLSFEGRPALLRMTVDLDPFATIWLAKAGVLVEARRFDLGVPGVVGVVSFDDLPTDLTGNSFLEGRIPESLKGWLSQQARRLRAFALPHLKAHIAQREDRLLLQRLT